MASSVIFVGSPEKSPKSCTQKLKTLFFVPPHDVIFRIFASFVPPFSKKYQKVYVDLQGPVLALLLLTAFLNYGYSFKTTNTFCSPTETVIIYSLIMPVMSFFVCKIGRSCITLSEMTSLIGYGLYGHIFTLFVSFLIFEETSNFFFFVCLIIFGGLSTLRIALVVLGTLFLPAARLLICSLISTCNILFVIFLHFAYMHRTFVS
ncbi:protein YIPF3-like [Tribolium madens]|uniref:protein YIPF3-like n=1 Tax=Tribolium madens TaxID=41895 RepID=UPI001CF7489E|nr:protein YIPF3-like [Tribolium madens]